MTNDSLTLTQKQIHISPSKEADSLRQVIESIHTDKNIELIKAIGGLWPIVICVTVIVVLIIYRKKIELGITKIKRFKGGIGNANIEVTTSTTSETDNTGVAKLTETTANVSSEDNELVTTEQSPEPVTTEISVFSAYMIMKGGDKQKADEIFEQVQNSATSIEDRETNEIIYNALAYSAGFSTSFEVLQRFANTSAINISRMVAKRNLANIYRSNAQFEKAIQECCEAMNLASDDREKKLAAKIAMDAAPAYHNLGLQKAYIRLLIEQTMGIEDANIKSDLYKKISEAFKSLDMMIEHAAFLLKANECLGNNKSLLFDIAYAFADLDHNEIALHYYNLSHKVDSNQESVLNNSGVALDNLGLKSMAMEKYTKSYLLGNTLAAANIAGKYIGIGMVDEAKKILDKAKESGGEIHTNVWKALEDIDNLKQKDKAKLKEIDASALLINRFYIAYSSAIMAEDKSKFIFSLALTNSADKSQLLTINEEERSILLKIGVSEIKIYLSKEISNTGSCHAEFKATSTQYISESYKGQFVYDSEGLQILLLSPYLHNRTIKHFKFVDFTS